MYLARTLVGGSVTKIGKFYNGRHDTTVLHAVRRIEALRAAHAEVDGLLKSLAEEIQSRPAMDAQQRIHVWWDDRCRAPGRGPYRKNL